MDYSVVVREMRGDVVLDYYLCEKVFGKLQGVEFRRDFFGRVHLPCGLYVRALVAFVHNEVDFFLGVRAFAPVRDHSHVNGIAAHEQLVVNDVFHDVAGVNLAESEPGVAQADVRKIIFVRVVEIMLAFDIEAFCLAYQESVLAAFDVVAHGVRAELFSFHGFERVRDIERIRQRADERAERIQYVLENVNPLQFVALQNVLYVHLVKEARKVLFELNFGFQVKKIRQPAVDHVAVEVVAPVASERFVVFGKAQGIDVNPRGASAEFCRDVFGKHF